MFACDYNQLKMLLLVVYSQLGLLPFSEPYGGGDTLIPMYLL
jgi:hypothetical protein